MRINKPCRRVGFTLVELLVVIGIIAVLVSLLLPALTKARESAQTLACLSNLKQIGLGFAMYARNNGECLPPGDWNTTWGDAANDTVTWYTLINPYVGGKGYSQYTTGISHNVLKATVPAEYRGGLTLSKVFIDPGAAIPQGIQHYSSNPILIPRRTDIKANQYGGFPGGLPMPQKTTMLRPASDVVLVGDGFQRLTGTTAGWAVTVAAQMDGTLASSALWFRGPASRTTYYNRVINWNNDFDHNTDGGSYWGGDWRARHNRNKAVNFVFADGHADTFLKRDVRSRFFVPPNWSIK